MSGRKKNSLAKTVEGQVVEQPKQNSLSAEGLISQAISRNVPVETLERLLAMRDKLKAEAAREAYFTALANFQAVCPEIKKQKAGGETRSGAVAYYYAPLDAIVKQVREPLKKHGFSYKFLTDIKPDKVMVICETHHKDGHSERTSMESAMSTRTSVMSAPQQVAATVTFLKRYAFCNAFGIMTADDDVDGRDLQTPPPPRQPAQKPATPPKMPRFISASQAKLLEELIVKKGKSIESALNFYKIKALGGLNLEEGQKLIKQLQALPDAPAGPDAEGKTAEEDVDPEVVDYSMTHNVSYEEAKKEVDKIRTNQPA